MAKITKEKVTSCLKGSALTLATLLGVIGGIILGITLKASKGKWTVQWSLKKCTNEFASRRNFLLGNNLNGNMIQLKFVISLESKYNISGEFAAVVIV